jgi:hypothetical protein
LRSSFHGIDIIKDESNFLQKIAGYNYSGILTGVPSETLSTGRLTASNIERLIRGISGKKSGVVAIANPMDNIIINQIFSMVLNEIRIISESERHVGQENPTVRQYKALLEKYLEKLQKSKSHGSWTVSYFLYADTSEELDQLKALTKIAYSGRESVPDRIRTHEIRNGRIKPGIIINPPPVSPGQFKWPFMYSTILSSGDLANLIRFSRQELPGYQIKPYVRFNVSPKSKTGIKIGRILDQETPIDQSYHVRVKRLRRHGLIVGSTGSGKTNTLFYILKQLLQQDIPFLVLEPAKKEYRNLLGNEEFHGKLQVFTLGDNTVSPFRLNPFYVHEGIPVQTHLDLLKSVFNASFYMWGPLPHVLERCLYEIYRDKGWDLTSNQNLRGKNANAYPTLTDLYNKVDRVVDELGYSPETTMELKSSLKTRLNSLRIGGKGLMLDTKSSIAFEKLLGKPTVLELETLGDDEEKAFLMGLVLTMMYEYYVSRGLSNGGLNHVTIIEEAHRLLGDTEKNTAYTGDMKGKAVETFTNILSEIRAYGEGFLIADQIPTKLSRDVIKNSNLKIMHRIVSKDDRSVMASSMNIKEQDAPIVSSLTIGKAVVFSEGDDGAYKIQVPYAKLDGENTTPQIIREEMKQYIEDYQYIAPYLSCSKYCSKICQYKDIGNEIRTENRYIGIFPSLVLSILDGQGYQDNLIQIFESGNDFANVMNDELGIKTCALVQGAEQFFESLGARYNWPYTKQIQLVYSFLDLLTDTLQKYISQQSVSINEDNRKSFHSVYLEMCNGIQPTKYCQRICVDGSCQYRYLIDDTLTDEDYHTNYVETINNGGPALWSNLSNLCEQVAIDIHPYSSDETLIKVGSCFALQKSFQIESFQQRHIDQIMNNLLEFEPTNVGEFTQNEEETI